MTTREPSQVPLAAWRRGRTGRAGAFGPTLILLAFIGASCAADVRPVPVDSGLTFAAHEAHAGLVIDRTARGKTGMARPVGGLHLEPAFVLHTEDGAEEELRVTSPGRVVVERRAAGPDAAEVGRVEPSWEDDAIRLTLRPAAGPALQSGRFHRIDDGAGGSVLTRLDRDRIDLEGTYRATLRAPDGRAVGWLGLAVGGSQPGHVAYEGVLPREVDDGLAAGAAEALGSEIAFIEATGRGTSRKSEER